MNWSEVCSDPNLSNLPYKIELNERGQILMSPARLFHSILQGEIIRILTQFMKEGKAFPECAISTPKGTKVADVVWCSSTLFNQIKQTIQTEVAPEVCIEVFSPANTSEEMTEKKLLYFNQGAQEVWYCDEEGNLSFFDSNGILEKSNIFPEFPQKIEFA